MRKLKVVGDNTCQCITLFGDPQKQREPDEVRINFPGGHIYVARCSPETPGGRPQWYAHIGVFHPDHPDKHRVENMDSSGEPKTTGRIVDARVDCFDKGVRETIRLAEILAQPNVDHLAVKIAEGEAA